MSLRGYGGGHVTTIGRTELELTVDSAKANIVAHVVPDDAQADPMLVGHTFTELPHILVVKDFETLTFIPRDSGTARDESRDNVLDQPKAGDAILVVEAPEPIELEQVVVGNVSEEDRTLLMDTLTEFRDCIAMSIHELGRAQGTEMTIELTDPTPFSYRPYRMAPSEQKAVDTMIAELLETNLICESSSPYASPVVLVPKKSGEQRLCVDYRKLNARTVKYSYPIPRIDDQIDRLSGATCFIAIDLRCGYYQMNVAEKSRQYTSFVTVQGQYEWLRMPFGLTNAPRVFQRYMDKVLKPVKQFAAVYLDDILIHASSPKEAISHLREVFELLREAGLTLHLGKCAFLVQKVTFLGFEVENGMVRPGQEKTEAVSEFPRPTTVHNIRQFLGLTGYFRHFVRNYASIARPLTQLLKQDQAWQWTEVEESAFQELKEVLARRPVLAVHRPGAATEVHTDASTIGVAGILVQKQADDKLHPVAYYSRQTKEVESRYHSYELEVMAIVESLKKFRCYLLGVPFTVVTDCNSIKGLAKKANLNGRIARWWLQLQEFDFEVQYCPGERMKHADALSRNPIQQEEPDDNFVLRIEPADWVLSAQLTDPEVSKWRETLLSSASTTADQQVQANFALRKDRVYRKTSKGLLWCVPKGMRHEIVRSAHEAVGHASVEKTLEKVSEAYWFPRMRRYIDRYIKCCIRCLYTKRKAGRREGLLNPIPKGTEPLRVFHVDHVGPYPPV
jgi:hypothetical protein